MTPKPATAALVQPAPTATPTASYYPPLEAITKPGLTTGEAGYYLDRKPQTMRAWACLENGPIRPVRINGRLAWSTAAVKSLLGVNQSGFANIALMAGVAAVAYFAPV
jgi:hypothetical protein